MSVSTSPTDSTTVRRPRLHGRVAFVTGGTRGIGAAICHSLAEQGADVAAGYSRDRETAEAFIGKLTQEGLKGGMHQGNIGLRGGQRRAAAAAPAARLGQGAGIAGRRRLVRRRARHSAAGPSASRRERS